MRIFVVKKNTLIRAAVFVLLVVGAIIYTQIAFGSSAPVSGGNEAFPVCRVAADEKVVALTFDTAFGDDDSTQQILDVLNDEGVKATFFVMGLWAKQNGKEVKAIADAGQEIGNHSMNHTRYTDMAPEDMVKDASDASDIIFQLSGYDTKLLRMPYGAFDTPTINTLEAAGYIPVKWSLDSLDWKGYDAEKIADGVLSKVKSGDIIMFQNNMPATSEALAAIILGLREDGYKIVPVSQMLLDDGVVDSQGTQIHFND